MQLVADNLAVERGGRTIFDNLSFIANRGEALVLTGSNGSGKTTLIRTLAGFLQPSAGTLRFEGFADPDLPFAEHCHYVGHQNGVKSALTARENAAFWHGFLAGPRSSDAAAIDAALEAFGLLALSDIPAGYFSAGQMRRLALTRLLMAKRPVWLLDEPTASLDDASRTALDRIIDGHLGAGGLAIIATHQPLGLVSQRALRLGGMAEAA